MSLFICDRLMLWRQSIFICISIPILCSIPIPVSSSSSASPKGNCPPHIYGRLIESALRKHDFHVISIQIVWLTAKSIFALPPAAGSQISILDWSLFICIGSLPVAPECCCSMIGKSWATNDVSSDLSAQCPQLKTICNLLAAPTAIAGADTFCATPIDLLNKHSDWDNGTLEQHLYTLWKMYMQISFANDLCACAAICWMPRWQFSANAALPVFCNALNNALQLAVIFALLLKNRTF